MPSIVVMRRPVTAASGVTQLLVGRPSTCTVQAPQRAMPQPNFVPVSSRKSRSTQRSGVSGSASTVIGLPFTLSGVIDVSLADGNSRPAARRDSPWPDTRGLLVDLRFGEPDWRVVAAVLRAGDERLRAHVLEDAFVGKRRVAEHGRLQAVLAVGAQEPHWIRAGEPGIDAVDVRLELADERPVVGRVERRPELLHDLAARILERLVEA